MHKTKHVLFLAIPFLFICCCACSPVSSRAVAGTKIKASSSPAQQPNGQPVSSPPRSPEMSNRFNRQVLNYINEMRKDPKGFYHRYVEDYIRQKSDRFTAQYTRSLKTALLRAPSLPLFATDAKLEKTATLQLDYLARFDGRKLSHERGKISFAERMKQAGLHCLAENLYVADDPEPLEVVLDLLIDQRVPSFGHRKNLMNAMYTHIGIVSKTLKGGKTLVVMDFGCGR